MSDMAIKHSSEQSGNLLEEFKPEALPERPILEFLMELTKEGNPDTSMFSLRARESVAGPGGVKYLLVDALPPGTTPKKPKPPLFSYEFIVKGENEKRFSDSTSIAKIYYNLEGVPVHGAIVAVYENNQWRRTG